MLRFLVAPIEHSGDGLRCTSCYGSWESPTTQAAAFRSRSRGASPSSPCEKILVAVGMSREREVRGGQQQRPPSEPPWLVPSVMWRAGRPTSRVRRPCGAGAQRT